MNQNIIIVEGLIGVGKSTILSQVDPVSSDVFKESYDASKIARHYEDPTPENALAIQLEFYDNLHIKMDRIKESRKNAYLDRSLIGNLAFTLLNLSIGQLPLAESCVLIEKLLEELKEELNDGTRRCVVYLTDDIELIQQRVKKRGREMEKNLDVGYQRRLHIWYVIVLSYLKSLGYPVLVLTGLESFSILRELSADELMQVAIESKFPTPIDFDIKEYLKDPVDIETLFSFEDINTYLTTET